jgi:hypothetical protein
MSDMFTVYRSRKPYDSQYYQCVEEKMGQPFFLMPPHHEVVNT